jgi:hypothetical protein
MQEGYAGPGRRQRVAAAIESKTEAATPTGSGPTDAVILKIELFSVEVTLFTSRLFSCTTYRLQQWRVSATALVPICADGATQTEQLRLSPLNNSIRPADPQQSKSTFLSHRHHRSWLRLPLGGHSDHDVERDRRLGAFAACPPGEAPLPLLFGRPPLHSCYGVFRECCTVPIFAC